MKICMQMKFFMIFFVITIVTVISVSIHEVISNPPFTGSVKLISTFYSSPSSSLNSFFADNSTTIIVADCSSEKNLFSYVNIIFSNKKNKNNPIVIGQHFSHSNSIIDLERRKSLEISIEEAIDGMIGKDGDLKLVILISNRDGLPSSTIDIDAYVKDITNEIENIITNNSNILKKSKINVTIII